MQHSHFALAAAAVIGLALPALAQDTDFSLTYHVERTPAARLSIETCGKTVADAAASAGLQGVTQSYPGQLVTVSGGAAPRGAFVVQCIAVGDTTVSVVQGIDYRAQKGALGEFADQVFAAIKSAVE
ncbi:hypothetical protein GL279_16200 [Paracoccus limosus]|uniref:Uncharacterized protein n=1 Tax=Paracoccus limosus TaxID=913252 RepID=A0A844H5T6_9RHOB|nr:DUF6180 family protein [Paracoccus limosus]MTH36142.1 hypothetical protein [Paracoccus limosus]